MKFKVTYMFNEEIKTEEIDADEFKMAGIKFKEKHPDINENQIIDVKEVQVKFAVPVFTLMFCTILGCIYAIGYGQFDFFINNNFITMSNAYVLKYSIITFGSIFFVCLIIYSVKNSYKKFKFTNEIKIKILVGITAIIGLIIFIYTLKRIYL